MPAAPTSAEEARHGDGTGPLTTPPGQVCAVLQPAVAEGARLAGVSTVGLVDVRGGRPGTALNLDLDRVATTYGDDRVLGPPGAAVRLACRLVGRHGVPGTPVPPVVARRAVAVAAEPGTALPAAVEHLPADALAVVVTTWALSRLRPPQRAGFVEALAVAATARTVAWVSVEGVGVAPGVPTLGDRPASGHSLVGLALLDRGRPGGTAPRVLGRCWSRGRVLSWLAAA